MDFDSIPNLMYFLYSDMNISFRTIINNNVRLDLIGLISDGILFFSTTEAKTDFMRIIRQTIRDSVRKMTVPSGSRDSLKSKYIPFGGKRLEALSSNPRSTLSKKRNSSSNKNQDERHSMELDGKFSVDDDGVFRTRSKTVGDLNEVSCEDGDDDNYLPASASQPQIPQNGTQ
jgi:hypothetical protein